MSEESVQIKITGKYVDQVSGGLRSLKGELVDVGKVAAGIGAGIIAAGGAIAAASIKALSAYGEVQRAEMQLAQTLKLRGEYTEKTQQALLDEASAIQRVTTSGDDANVALMNLLLTSKNLSLEQLPRVTMAVLDMSAALGLDARTAALLMQKALDGQTSTLSRYGLVIDEVKLKEQGFAAVLDVMEAKFGGQAATLRGTVTGAWESVRNLVGDLWEAAGKQLEPAAHEWLERLIILLDEANTKAAGLDWSPYLEALQTGLQAAVIGVGGLAKGVLYTAVGIQAVTKGPKDIYDEARIEAARKEMQRLYGRLPGAEEAAAEARAAYEERAAKPFPSPKLLARDEERMQAAEAEAKSIREKIAEYKEEIAESHAARQERAQMWEMTTKGLDAFNQGIDKAVDILGAFDPNVKRKAAASAGVEAAAPVIVPPRSEIEAMLRESLGGGIREMYSADEYEALLKDLEGSAAAASKEHLGAASDVSEFASEVDEASMALRGFVDVLGSNGAGAGDGGGLPKYAGAQFAPESPGGIVPLPEEIGPPAPSEASAFGTRARGGMGRYSMYLPVGYPLDLQDPAMVQAWNEMLRSLTGMMRFGTWEIPMPTGFDTTVGGAGGFKGMGPGAGRHGFGAQSPTVVVNINGAAIVDPAGVTKAAELIGDEIARKKGLGWGAASGR